MVSLRPVTKVHHLYAHFPVADPGGGKGGNCPSLGPKKRREEVKEKKRKQGKREKRRGESRKKESKANGTYTV